MSGGVKGGSRSEGGRVVGTGGGNVGAKVEGGGDKDVTSDGGGGVDEMVGADVGSTVGADVGAGGFGGPHVTLYAQSQIWVELSNRVPAGHEMG